jgi:hypothetical protein
LKKTQAPETFLLLMLVTLHQQLRPSVQLDGLVPLLALVFKHTAMPLTANCSSVLTTSQTSPHPPSHPLAMLSLVLTAAIFAIESSFTHNPTAAAARFINKNTPAAANANIDIIDPARFIVRSPFLLSAGLRAGAIKKPPRVYWWLEFSNNL